MVKKTLRYYCMPLFCLLLILVIRPALSAPGAINPLKVAYIYNIVKFTTWPAGTWASPTELFQLCFYAQDNMEGALRSLQNKKVNGHPIVLVRPEDKPDFQHCHALYLDTDERHRYRYLLSLIDAKTVLIISDESPFFAYGGHINLVEKAQRLRFEVNMQQLSRSQLKFSSKLLKLAILIDNPR